MKGKGPLEAGLKGSGPEKPMKAQNKAQLRAALSGLEDRSVADQAEAGVMKVVQQINSTSQLERTLKQLLEIDRCSSTAARHRFR